MKIQFIINVVSIHKSITSLTHLIDHSYFQTWDALLAAAISKMHFYFDIATDRTSGDENVEQIFVTHFYCLAGLNDGTSRRSQNVKFSCEIWAITV